MRTILLSITFLLSAILTAQTNNSSLDKTASGNGSNLTNEASLLQAIRGNWFRADAPNEWEYGIYEPVCIMQNRMFVTKGISKQGECIELTLQDKKNATITTLLFTPQPNGEYLIKANGGNEALYTKEGSTKPLMTTEPDFKEFIRKDTAYIQGYIDRYDPQIDNGNNIIFTGNNITDEAQPTLVNIEPDGSFECKLVLNHPIENELTIGNHYTPFYIEPGQTLSIYIDNEGNYDSTKFMGPSAALSQMYDKLRDWIRYPDELLSKIREDVDPNLFKKEVKAASIKCDQLGDSLIRTYTSSEKAVHLIKNKLVLAKACMLLDFIILRTYPTKDTANQILKAKEGNEYYDFLKYIPLNDQSLLTNQEYRQFINRFELMSPLREVQSDAYENKYFNPTANKNAPKISDRKQDKQTIDEVKSFLVKGDSVINQLSGQPNSFIWQTTLVRRLKYDFKAYNNPAKAKKHIDILNKYLTYPILIEETNRMFNTTYSKKADKTYQLPECKATEVFRNIIKSHSGKMLFVDFWGTSCGGCRKGIEETAQLRKEYKNHPEFQFIYITDERSSPKKAYDEYVAKNLEGEASYRINKSEYLLLRELFKFNGTPHYELIQKDGSVTVNPPTAWELEVYIKKRFEKSED